jgi:hypothetical protein
MSGQARHTPCPAHRAESGIPLSETFDQFCERQRRRCHASTGRALQRVRLKWLRMAQDASELERRGYTQGGAPAKHPWEDEA